MRDTMTIAFDSARRESDIGIAPLCTSCGMRSQTRSRFRARTAARVPDLFAA